MSGWFTAAEIAELGLPGLARSKRHINERATSERWALMTGPGGEPLARLRTGRGGGLEYHYSVLPGSAVAALQRRGVLDPAAAPAKGAAWAAFERLPEKVKVEAQRRASIIAKVELLEQSGMRRGAAVDTVARLDAVAASTVWNWLQLVTGIDPAQRLPVLAPRRTGGGRAADVDEEAWRLLKGDYLRPSEPTFASCYWRMVKDYAEPRGIPVPHVRTLWRKFEREVDPRLVVALRKGTDALRQTLPPQQRSVAHLHAMELVNIDGHKFDAFVRLADGRIVRPIMVAIQDVFSRKILAWRIGETESAVQTRLAFADLFRVWGIPKGCYMDNGRAFASKWITGGATSRFRFKIREEEPTGLLTALGIAIHWTFPFRGQSKPIERAFRDLCDSIARHPALDGAYTGNRTDAKPENYGARAVPLADFIGIVERGIAVHNARGGRRTETASGKSFDDAFARSYAHAPIGKATPEQLRLALLTADEVTPCRKTGAITLYGNRYWSPAMSAIAAKRVTVRFDPDDLSLDLHVYDRAGRYLCAAGMLEATGFDDVAAAKMRARQEAELRKTVRRAAELEQLLSAEEVAARFDRDAVPVDMPAASVIRPVRHRGQTAAALKLVEDCTAEPARPAFIDRLTAASERLRLVE